MTCCKSKCCSSCCNLVEHTLKPPPEDVEHLLKNTTLKVGQINYLYKRFCLIGKGSNIYPPVRLLKGQFLNLGHLQRNPILSILLNALFKDKKYLTFSEFAKFLSIFQANTLKTTKQHIETAIDKKIKLLFSMWDWDNDGVLSQEDLIHIVHKLFGDIMPTHRVLHVVNTMMDEMNSSNTQEILYEDFKNSLDVFDMSESLVVKIQEL